MKAMSFRTYEVVRDCEIIHHMGLAHDIPCDDDVDQQRKRLVDACQLKRDGLDVEHTILEVLVGMGLIEGNMLPKKIKLTVRGSLFLDQELGGECGC